MIEQLEQTIASIVKAMREADMSGGKRSNLNPLTRLNNKMITMRIKEAQLLELFKELEEEKGNDN